MNESDTYGAMIDQLDNMAENLENKTPQSEDEKCKRNAFRITVAKLSEHIEYEKFLIDEAEEGLVDFFAEDQEDEEFECDPDDWWKK